MVCPESRLRFVMLVLALVALNSACAFGPTPARTPSEVPPTTMKPTPSSAARPSDLTVTYHWQEGSVPPPYHYEYEVRVGPGSEGEVIFYPDYPGKDTPVWHETFAVGDDAWDKFYTLLMGKRFFAREWRKASRPLVGGSLASLDVFAQATRYGVPSQLEPADAAVASEIYDAIRALVPPSVWDSLMTRRQKYEKEHQER